MTMLDDPPSTTTVDTAGPPHGNCHRCGDCAECAGSYWMYLKLSDGLADTVLPLLFSRCGREVMAIARRMSRRHSRKQRAHSNLPA